MGPRCTPCYSKICYSKAFSLERRAKEGIYTHTFTHTFISNINRLQENIGYEWKNRQQKIDQQK